MPLLTSAFSHHVLPWHKIWSFPLGISVVNVNKSTASWRFVYITKDILNGKFHFCVVHDKLWSIQNNN